MRRLEMIVSRLAWFVPTLAGLVVIVFLISNVIPTDPVKVLLGENATPAQIEAMRVKLGYDQPLGVQLARHFRDIVTGNLGISIYSQRPISEDLAQRQPATLEVTLVAISLSFAPSVTGAWAWAALAAKSSVPTLADASRYLALVMSSLPLLDIGSDIFPISWETYTYQSIRQAHSGPVYYPIVRTEGYFGILLVLEEDA